MLKRVLVSLLLELARTFGASINVTRDTPDNGPWGAFQKLGCVSGGVTLESTQHEDESSSSFRNMFSGAPIAPLES